MILKISHALKNRKGFTLVELMVVVVIIGILAAIAVPVYNKTTDKANQSAVEANLRTIDGAIMQYQASSDTTAAPVKADLEGDYIANWPTGPDGVTYSINAAAPFQGVATKGADTGAWFPGAAGATLSLPISTWP